MNSVNELFESLKAKAQQSNSRAIGYPVNRQHAFKIDKELLGFTKNSLATTYLNNIASPYEYGTYVSGHIKELEIELMAKLAEYLKLSKDDHFGYTTYGGTEANTAAIWWHKKFLAKKYNSRVSLLCSKYSHYSLRKIADLLDLELVYIEATEYQLDLIDLENKIQIIDTPIIFLANFGNTVYGAIDDVIMVNTLLNKYKNGMFKIHGDAAIYGLCVPQIEPYNKLTSIFEIVDTFSFSGHKFLGSYSICGVILTKRSYLDAVFSSENTHIGYIQKAIDVTVSGSRQGFYAAELYLLVNEGLKLNDGLMVLTSIWNSCNQLANWLSNALKENFPNSKITHNYIRVVFPAPESQETTDFLGQKYGLMPVENSQLGIYVFPRVAKAYLEEFLFDYIKAFKTN